MRHPLAIVALFAAPAAAAGSDGEWESLARDNPVEGVTKLLERLNAKISEEAKTEAAAYDKFACFCKDQADEKLYAITKKTERINELTATIKECTMTIEEYTGHMNDATTKKDELEKESKAAKAKSLQDFVDFTAFKNDHVNALKELDRAIKAVKAAGEATGGAAASAAALIEEFKRQSDLFDAEERQDPAAYEFKGGGVLDTLMKLKIKFTARLKTIENDESERTHSVAMQEQARQFEITGAKEMITKSQDIIGRNSAEKSSAQSEKQATEADRADDQAFLNKVTEECEDKAVKWDARSQRRSGEMTAIAEALQILKGDATTRYASAEARLAMNQRKKGVVAAKKQVANKTLAAVQEGVKASKGGSKGHWEWKKVWVSSFLQLSSVSSSSTQATAMKKMLQSLEDKAKSLKSGALYGIVVKLRDSPFDSVKRMIEGLIDKIDEEQTAEDDEISDCKDSIIAATTQRQKMAADMQDEEARIIENSALSDKKTKEIKELATEIEELYKGLADATKIRTTEKKENEAAVADATAGKFSVDKAIGVLRTFYEASFEGGFVQTSEEPDIGAPEASDFLGDDPAEDPSKQGESSGIFGLLQTVAQDYQDAVDKVTEEEEDAQGAYDTFKSDTESDIATKKDLKRTAETTKQTAIDTVETAKDDLADWTKQKGEAEQELAILNPRCLGLGASAEERKQRREEEKTALGDAITILETMAPAEAPAPTEPEMFLEKRSAVKRA